MKQVWIIAGRELKSFFDSLVAYILLIAFLGFSGFFTWIFGTDVFFVKQATLAPFFNISHILLFLFISALTMKMIAEEKRSGTIELLLTKSVTDWQFVLGKFLACLLLVVIALAFTLPYYLSIAYLGPIDHAATWAGYLGTILVSMTYIGIGLFASSISTNQIVAFLTSLFIGAFFFILFDVIASGLTGYAGQLFAYLSLSTHFDSISRGVLDSKDVIYFVSVTFLGLALAESVLSRRNIVE